MAIEIKIQRRWDKWAAEVFIFERLEGQRVAYLTIESITSDGLLVVKRTVMDEGLGVVRPSLVIQSEFAAEFLPAIAKAIDEAGIPRPSEDFKAGKLLATEKHLEDMRTLAFGGNRDAYR